jgi:hypothetical protein
MGRNIFAWLLLALGLAAIANSLIMGYTVYVVTGVEVENAKKNARMNPDVVAMPPPGFGSWQYRPAAFSILAGLILSWIGFNTRVVQRKKKPKREVADAGSKQTCAACGGRSPEFATKCYHCGAPILPA